MFIISKLCVGSHFELKKQVIIFQIFYGVFNLICEKHCLI